MKKVTITLLAVLFLVSTLVANIGPILATIEPITYGQPELVDPTTVTPAPAAAAPAAAAPAAAAPAAAAPVPIGDFVVTEITCDPSRVIAGSKLEVIVVVKNAGASESTQTLVLNGDGAEVDREELTLAAGASEEVVFKYQTKTTASPESQGQTVQGQKVEGGAVERDVTVEVGGVTTTFLLVPTPFMPIT
ncbi:CARDB domain-containing protein [Halobacteriota archaeon]